MQLSVGYPVILKTAVEYPISSKEQPISNAEPGGKRFACTSTCKIGGRERSLPTYSYTYSYTHIGSQIRLYIFPGAELCTRAM